MLPLAATLLLASVTTGQEDAQAPPVASYPQDFCKWWKGFGTFYDNPDNNIVQQMKFFGRLHYQAGLLDGEGSGQEFNYGTDQIRRFRTGFGAKFLKHFDLYAEAEIGADRRPRGGDFNVRFQHMWQFKVHFDAKKAFNLDSVDGLRVGVGSREINMSYEWVTSSKRIKSIERSAVANKIWAFNSEFANPTGAWVETKLKPVTFTVGAFSTTQDDWLAPFDDGELYYGNMKWDLHDGPNGEDTDVRFSAFYQDRAGNDAVLAAGLDWAAALSMQHKEGPWEFHAEAIAGDNGRQSNANREGDFWAFVFMPSYWIYPNSLEAAFQFQYQGSHRAQGVRINSRYARRAAADDNLGSTWSSGRGDEHYTFYAGLNKLFCGHQHKVMFGVEYNSLHQNGNELLSTWTALVAYRTYW